MINVLMGIQSGDEGKGKVIDYLADDYDIICRFSGGPNAGHSIHFNDKKYVVHLLPSGIFKDKINVIGNGCVIDPIGLKKEIEEMQEFMNLDKLFISNKAHIITPFHIEQDRIKEDSLGTNKIGSTLKGMGPVYTDKISRNGFRVGDLFNETKYKKLKGSHKSNTEFLEAIEFLKTLKIIDTSYFLNWELKNGTKILAEGAQGTMLDIDFGTYPFVTSCNTTIGSVCTGLGIPPKYINKIYGVTKAYFTRVGNGPSPTQIEGDLEEKIREIGLEYGATTGRPRHCGWLDLVSLKYACMINGITDLVITKLDILNDFDEIKVCTSYMVNGKETMEVPFDLYDAEPIYTTFQGWKSEINENLPTNLTYFIDSIESYLDTNVSHISISPDRNGIIIM